MTENNYGMDFEDTKPGTDNVVDGSPLDMLREELAKEVALPDTVMNIPNRENIRAVYVTTIDGDLFQRWMKSARARKGSDDIDALRFSSIVLANQLKTLEVKNKKTGTWMNATNDGSLLNIHNPLLKEMLVGDQPSNGAAYLIRKLYGNDGSILASAQELIVLAGYGDQADDLFGDEGPTRG